MTDFNREAASKLYALAVARDAANLIDIDAGLALARASVRALMALSPQAALLTRSFVQEEMDRLSMECSEESIATIAIMGEAIA